MGKKTPTVGTNNVVWGTPLMGQAVYGDGAVGLESHIPFAVGVLQQIQSEYAPSAPHQTEMVEELYDNGEYDEASPVCYRTGGMYLTAAARRTTSFFTQGAKWYDPESGNLYLATSTSGSNRPLVRM